MTITKLAANLLRRLWKIEYRRCAQCWAPMQLQEDNHGNGVLICPNRCELGGHVSDIFVRYEQIRDKERAAEVARHYPRWTEACGYDVPTAQERAEAAASLFSDGRVNPEDIARYARTHGERLPDEYWTQNWRSETYAHQRIDEAWRRLSGNREDTEGSPEAGASEPAGA